MSESAQTDRKQSASDRVMGEIRVQGLLHQKQPSGWQKEGPDYALMARNRRGLYD